MALFTLSALWRMKLSSRGWDLCGCTVFVGMVTLSGTLTACGGNIESSGTLTSIGADPIARWAPSPVAQHKVLSRARPPSPNTAPDRFAAPRGVLLDGVPGTYACTALRGYIDESVVGASAATATPERLRLNAVIAPTATIGQVNAALRSVGARIVSMQPGNSEVMLDLATPGGRPSQVDMAAQLIATRAFESVGGTQPAARFTPTATIPSAFDPSAPAPVEDHQSPS